MTGARWRRTGLAAAWLLFAAYALWGVPSVPFHPDESTYLYMSRDFDLLIKQAEPAAVSWDAANQPADVLRYRLLDAPLAHYLPGLGRLLGGYANPLPRDWNWSADWAANVAAGSLPDPGELAAARWPAALLVVLSVLPLYGIGLRLAGPPAALGAVLLYVLSGLVLLHGRRAMSEGPLLFFILAGIWLVLYQPRRTWLWAGAAGFALAAKLTGLALLPVMGLAWLWRPTAGPAGPTQPGSHGQWVPLAKRATLFVVPLTVLSYLLSPALWRQPVNGLAAMLAARLQLSAGVTAALSGAAPAQVSGTLGARLFAMLYQVYFAPPAIWDVPNYAAQTALAEQGYLANPLQLGWHTQSLGFNLAAGGALLALTLAGLAFSLHDLAAAGRRGVASLPSAERTALIVLLVWTASTIAILLPININWQRYYLPLLPIACLWAACGSVRLARPIASAASQYYRSLPR